MSVNSRTYSQKPSEVSRRWILIDASEAPLGRVATQIATYLIGKYKPSYTPHIDGKETGKIYYRHSGFPGGIKDATLSEVREKYPERIIEAAVKGMLPKNKLSSDRMQRLRVFPGSDHTHTAQTPEKVEVK